MVGERDPTAIDPRATTGPGVSGDVREAGNRPLQEKAIRFRHPDYNLDRAQKLISLSMSRHLSTRNISSKFMHTFLSNLANRQTDTQTDKRGQTHLPPPLSEVITADK